MADDPLEQLAAEAPWKATSYIVPHEYVMEHWSKEVGEFVELVRQQIRQNRYWRRFQGRKYPTVNIDEHYYWTLRLDYPEVVDGQRPGGPICLNRARRDRSPKEAANMTGVRQHRLS
jgi:hypothetical protein